MKVCEAPVPDPGLKETAVGTPAIASESDAVRALPFNAADSVAVWPAVIVPAVAMNVAVVDPAATTTEPATVNAAVLLDRVTVPPLVFDRVTAHVVDPPG